MFKVAFQGKLGAYSESACLHLYGNDCELFPMPEFEDVFDAVKTGQVDYGVLPVENSTTGSIHQNFDLMLQYRLPIVREIKLQIEHALLAPIGLTIEQLEGIRSHPQALAQCSMFFKQHPKIKALPDFDTAGSAEICAQENGKIGAIASELAAEEYGLDVLATNLENQNNTNFTRFLSFTAINEVSQRKNLKTSIILIPKVNQPGSLYSSLGVFAKNNIDLLKIESRPKLGSPWQYTFYIDFEGTTDSPAVESALKTLSKNCEEILVLGCYPIGDEKKLFTQRKSQ
jgi:prephenate dehydratase